MNWAGEERTNKMDDLVLLSNGDGGPIHMLIRSGQLELFLRDVAGKPGRYVGEPNGKTGSDKKPVKTWPVAPITYRALAKLACRRLRNG